MAKRKIDELLEEDWSESKCPKKEGPSKNSLDSDEEDDEKDGEKYNVMNEDDIEGVEEASNAPETTVGFTAFNMKEELEEGHFDQEGHYHWKKEKEIKDNWLDNIDWMQVKPSANASGQVKNSEEKDGGLGDSDSESDDDAVLTDTIPIYREILGYLKPGETISRALQRLGKGKKPISSAERWRRKKEEKARKDGSIDAAQIAESNTSNQIVKLTELANKLLCDTGNLDVYEETYEEIKKKVHLQDDASLDMYADDFDVKEKAQLEKPETSQDVEAT